MWVSLTDRLFRRYFKLRIESLKRVSAVTQLTALKHGRRRPVNVMPGLRLPTQRHSVTARWPVSKLYCLVIVVRTTCPEYN